MLAVASAICFSVPGFAGCATFTWSSLFFNWCRVPWHHVYFYWFVCLEHFSRSLLFFDVMSFEEKTVQDSESTDKSGDGWKKGRWHQWVHHLSLCSALRRGSTIGDERARATPARFPLLLCSGRPRWLQPVAGGRLPVPTNSVPNHAGRYISESTPKWQEECASWRPHRAPAWPRPSSLFITYREISTWPLLNG